MLWLLIETIIFSERQFQIDFFPFPSCIVRQISAAERTALHGFQLGGARGNFSTDSRYAAELIHPYPHAL
jgi:hypothetical protein